jgi:hypothetical protein
VRLGVGGGEEDDLALLRLPLREQAIALELAETQLRNRIGEFRRVDPPVVTQLTTGARAPGLGVAAGMYCPRNALTR